MAQELTISRKCPQCFGTGLHNPAYGVVGALLTVCNWPGCNGTGYIEYEKIMYDPGNDDILDRCNDVLEKCDDIIEKCDDILGALS